MWLQNFFCLKQRNNKFIYNIIKLYTTYFLHFKYKQWSSRLDDRDAVVRVVCRAGAISFDDGGLWRVLGAVLHVSPAQALAVILGEDEQHERVDAAVRVAEADADVVRIDEGDGGRAVAQVDHLDDVVGRPADQEQGNDHQHHLGGPLRPHGLFAFHPADGAEDVVEGERVEGADDDQWNDEAQNGLVESVPVHVLRPIQ